MKTNLKAKGATNLSSTETGHIVQRLLISEKFTNYSLLFYKKIDNEIGTFSSASMVIIFFNSGVYLVGIMSCSD